MVAGNWEAGLWMALRKGLRCEIVDGREKEYFWKIVAEIGRLF
jgi:hypothetical protein